MKKYIIKIAALLLLTSVAISSCSLEYRQRHGRGNQPGRDNDHGHHDDHDHHYDNVHRY